MDPTHDFFHGLLLFGELCCNYKNAVIDDYYEHSSWDVETIQMDTEIVKDHRKKSGANDPLTMAALLKERSIVADAVANFEKSFRVNRDAHQLGRNVSSSSTLTPDKKARTSKKNESHWQSKDGQQPSHKDNIFRALF